MLSKRDLGVEFRLGHVSEGLSGFYNFILRVLDNVGQSCLLASSDTVLFFTLVDAIVKRLFHQEFTTDVMLFLSYFKVVGFVGKGLVEHIFLVSSTSLTLHFLNVHGVRNDIS